MNRKLFSLILTATVPLFTAACDEDDDLDVAVYRAQLAQINPLVGGGTASARAEVVIEGDDIISFQIDGVGLDQVDHPTFLRTGSSCPTLAADVNADGVVDVVEGQGAYGSVLLPLDANLATQAIEPGTFPFGGVLLYDESDDFTDVFDAIDGPDANPNDFLTSLAPGEPLALDTRTIVVHGVAAALVNPLPAGSVQGITGSDIELPGTVPILCGKLVLVP